MYIYVCVCIDIFLFFNGNVYQTCRKNKKEETPPFII